ncbi:MAG TPA: DDE-type integrase/transposase/recombinase, partial [Candidatus Tectomicrobia bacterium]|nr:DDE-type integrase/transposase/recombinase [Candidatus Tectomicrobia bacterium]
RHGVTYLVAMLDWYSRDVLPWPLSNTMDVAFCLMALAQALGEGRLEGFNTDQGAQFTSLACTTRLAAAPWPSAWMDGGVSLTTSSWNSYGAR